MKNEAATSAHVDAGGGGAEGGHGAAAAAALMPGAQMA
jgi:hypothetical protein